MYGLLVQHFRKDQTWWNANRGRTYFYQIELPCDPANQVDYMAGATCGWEAYKVADNVTRHEAVGTDIYASFTADPTIVLESAVEVPRTPGVTFASVTTFSLGDGKGRLMHLVNDAGDPARPGATRQTLVHYP